MDNMNIEPAIVALLERVRGGDAEAVREFVERFGPAVQRELRFRLLDQRIGRWAGGSDLFQSTLTRFLLGLHLGRFELRNSDDLRRVLTTLAQRQVIDAARYWKARRRDVRRDRQFELTAEAVRVAAVSSATPSRVVAARELVVMALSRMEPRDRQIAAWRQEGLDWREIHGRCPEFPSAEALRKAHQRAIRKIALEIGFVEPAAPASPASSDGFEHSANNGSATDLSSGQPDRQVRQSRRADRGRWRR